MGGVIYLSFLMSTFLIIQYNESGHFCTSCFSYPSTSIGIQKKQFLKTGTKASDAIQSVFGLLNDLKQSNADAQYAADEKNKTDEYIGEQQELFIKIKSLNQKLFQQSQDNRVLFEQSLQETKNYLAWNEQRVEELERKIQALLDNQCYSNQLFVRSIKHNLEALEVIKLLKSDVAGYVINGDSFELVQQKTQSIGEKLKQYSNLFQDHQIKSFMALATTQENDAPGREATLAERVLHILETLEAELQGSLENLQTNEINASWELAGWVALAEAEIATLNVEYERKQVFADRTATQISAALAQQAKSKIILQESQDALDQAQSDLEAKRESYAAEKAKRDEENAILDEMINIIQKKYQQIIKKLKHMPHQIINGFTRTKHPFQVFAIIFFIQVIVCTSVAIMPIQNLLIQLSVGLIFYLLSVGVFHYGYCTSSIDPTDDIIIKQRNSGSIQQNVSINLETLTRICMNIFAHFVIAMCQRVQNIVKFVRGINLQSKQVCF
ncbi:hypothetical protein pb186bvf_013790 [Paramecium bursaria]